MNWQSDEINLLMGLKGTWDFQGSWVVACIAGGQGWASGLILGLLLVHLDHKFTSGLERSTGVDKDKAWAGFGIGARVVTRFRKAASLS